MDKMRVRSAIQSVIGISISIVVGWGFGVMTSPPILFKLGWSYDPYFLSYNEVIKTVAIFASASSSIVGVYVGSRLATTKTEYNAWAGIICSIVLSLILLTSI